MAVYIPARAAAIIRDWTGTLYCDDKNIVFADGEME